MIQTAVRKARLEVSTQDDAIRIPPLNQCALSSEYDPETKCAQLTLKYWCRGNLIAITEPLPENYEKMGYLARKAKMVNVVRKVQVKLAVKIRELSPCQQNL